MVEQRTLCECGCGEYVASGASLEQVRLGEYANRISFELGWDLVVVVAGKHGLVPAGEAGAISTIVELPSADIELSARGDVVRALRELADVIEAKPNTVALGWLKK